jgi:hypothetical protein
MCSHPRYMYLYRRTCKRTSSYVRNYHGNSSMQNAPPSWSLMLSFDEWSTFDTSALFQRIKRGTSGGRYFFRSMFNLRPAFSIQFLKFVCHFPESSIKNFMPVCSSWFLAKTRLWEMCIPLMARSLYPWKHLYVYISVLFSKRGAGSFPLIWIRFTLVKSRIPDRMRVR